MQALPNSSSRNLAQTERKSMTYDRQQAIEMGMLTLLIGREALNQSYAAMLGVGWSVRNRVLRPRYWGTDWLSVIAHKFAYQSMTCPGDVNLVKYPALDQKAWQTVAQAAEFAYIGTAQDPVSGATHYHSEMAEPPTWAKAPDTIFIIQIDSLKFFKAA